MKELEIINKQIQLLDDKSRLGALELNDIKILESLVRSRMLIHQTPDESNTENPLSDLDVESLKRGLAEASNGKA